LSRNACKLRCVLLVGLPLYALDGGLAVYKLLKVLDVDDASDVTAISNCSAMLVK
jgi:hypothetical protein